jgi:single-strand DNA-binding protein
MSNDINPNNYDGVTAVVVGRAGGPVEFKNFDGGGSQAELSIAVSQGYKNRDGDWVDTGTTWYRAKAQGEFAENNWPHVNKGDKVRLDEARLETREFKRKDESVGQAFELKFGTLTVVSEAPKRDDSDGDIPF